MMSDVLFVFNVLPLWLLPLWLLPLCCGCCLLLLLFVVAELLSHLLFWLQDLPNLPEWELIIRTDGSVDRRRYNAPSGGEVAGFMPGRSHGQCCCYNYNAMVHGSENMICGLCCR